MKTTALVFLIFFAVTNAKQAAPAAAVAPAGRCYKKVTNCCWKFGACGVQIGSILVHAKCPVKACATKCFNLCKPEVVPVATRKCYKTLKYAKKCYKHPWLPEVCVKYPVRKESCAEYKTTKLTVLCKKICPTVCTVAIKPCKYYRVLSYPKFCPTLACDKEAVLGNSVSPKVFVSSKGKFIKKSHTVVNK